MKEKDMKSLKRKLKLFINVLIVCLIKNGNAVASIARHDVVC